MADAVVENEDLGECLDQRNKDARRPLYAATPSCADFAVVYAVDVAMFTCRAHITVGYV